MTARMGSLRHRRSFTEDESYFISMTDIMVGLLFIFLILLTYFAFQIQTDSVPRTEFEELEAERDKLVIERDQLIRERDDLQSQIITLLLRIEALNERIAVLLSGNEKDQIAALLLRLEFADAEKDIYI